MQSIIDHVSYCYYNLHQYLLPRLILTKIQGKRMRWNNGFYLKLNHVCMSCRLSCDGVLNLLLDNLCSKLYHELEPESNLATTPQEPNLHKSLQRY